MGMSNKERQRRWMEKNRAAFNLRRRNARKDLSGGGVAQSRGDQQATDGRQLKPLITTDKEDHPPPAQFFTTKKVGEFRMVVIPEEVLEKVVVTKPVIFRDDYGRVISEAQWERLQERKERAKENGYVIDDYSQ